MCPPPLNVVETLLITISQAPPADRVQPYAYQFPRHLLPVSSVLEALEREDTL